MNSETLPQQTKLQTAWSAFNARISKIRSQIGKLLQAVDEEKRQKEIEVLRQKIDHS